MIPGRNDELHPSVKAMRHALDKATRHADRYGGKPDSRQIKAALAEGAKAETDPAVCNTIKFLLTYATACHLACSYLTLLGSARFGEEGIRYGAKALDLYDRVTAAAPIQAPDQPKLLVQVKTKKANALKIMRRYPEAEALCLEMLNPNPDDIFALTLLLEIYIVSNQRNKLRLLAEQCFAKLARADKTFCYQLSHAFEFLGDEKKHGAVLARLELIKVSAKRDPNADAARATGRQRPPR